MISPSQLYQPSLAPIRLLGYLWLHSSFASTDLEERIVEEVLVAIADRWPDYMDAHEW